MVDLNLLIQIANLKKENQVLIEVRRADEMAISKLQWERDNLQIDKDNLLSANADLRNQLHKLREKLEEITRMKTPANERKLSE